MESEKFAVGKFYQSKTVVCIFILLQVSVDCGLTHGEYFVDLLFGILKTFGNIKVIPSNVDLFSQ